MPVHFIYSIWRYSSLSKVFALNRTSTASKNLVHNDWILCIYANNCSRYIKTTWTSSGSIDLAKNDEILEVYFNKPIPGGRQLDVFGLRRLDYKSPTPFGAFFCSIQWHLRSFLRDFLEAYIKMNWFNRWVGLIRFLEWLIAFGQTDGLVFTRTPILITYF